MVWNWAASLIYLRVPGVNAAVRWLEADGIKVISGPQRIFRYADDALRPGGNHGTHGIHQGQRRQHRRTDESAAGQVITL